MNRSNLRLAIALLLFAFLLGSASATSGPFETDVKKLTAPKQELYLEAKKNLDEWTGEFDKLASAKGMIDSFIRSDPGFLPIYVEKARLLIMIGHTGNNDDNKHNQEALSLLRDVQKMDPKYPTSYVLAGHIYTNINDLSNAEKSLEEASRLTTTDPWLFLNWSGLYGRYKQYDKALEFAKKGLLASNDNSKALVSAIYYIGEFSKGQSGPARQQVTALIFETYKDPLQRLRIANRLASSYSGRNSEVLNQAYAILLRQKQETPSLPEVNVSLAELNLQLGMRSQFNLVTRYDPKYSSVAEQLLQSATPTATTKDRIFSGRVDIALSDDDFKKASDLVLDAEAKAIGREILLTKKALLLWLKKDYAAVIRIYEELSTLDPRHESNIMLAYAYAHSGNIGKLHEHHKRQIFRNPDSAWTIGNYATLLLQLDQIDDAIIYGNKALELMFYPLAQNTTSLAYLIKGSMFSAQGDEIAAAKQYAFAESIGYELGFVKANCSKHCLGVNKLLEKHGKKRSKKGIASASQNEAFSA